MKLKPDDTDQQIDRPDRGVDHARGVRACPGRPDQCDADRDMHEVVQRIDLEEHEVFAMRVGEPDARGDGEADQADEYVDSTENEANGLADGTRWSGQGGRHCSSSISRDLVGVRLIEVVACFCRSFEARDGTDWSLAARDEAVQHAYTEEQTLDGHPLVHAVEHAGEVQVSGQTQRREAEAAHA